jgi:ubiquinone/menaquinone biosynthesis C-methylase UbiE
MAIHDINTALGALGRPLSEFRHILDFGCGCGRLTLPLAAFAGADRITATDNDAEATAWLATRLLDATIETNSPLPPLSHPDDEFDLIIGWSILTHLPEAYQDAWLAEFARVLGPRGVMLQTVHGPTHFDLVGAAQDDPVRNALPTEGFIYYENHGPDSPFPTYYQTSYHHPAYIRRHWSKWFRVVDIRPRGARPTHDMVVLAARGPSSRPAKDQNQLI